ncbi:MAG: protein kinase domain-containing protein [Candidatus Polarisedimenticolia bacterium]
MIERDDWKRVDALLQQALDLPPAERDRWLREACAGDEALRARLEELLRFAEGEEDGLRPGGALGLPGESAAAAALQAGGGEEAALLPPGHRLGRYEIRRLLGAGGMGRVYCALDPTLDREVAIKALAGTFLGNSDGLRRFEREARVLAALSHPNIAAIYGFEQLDGAPYLILERVEGETLAERLARGPLPLREAFSVAVQVAEGLAEAHAKGVTHRDLKPSNVMLAASGRVKLVDFGLAKETAAGAEPVPPANPTTVAGMILGTAPYMSPEQINGDPVDSRTDIWGFGCLLYEMLTGKRAFTAPTFAAILASVLRDEPDWPALPGAVPAPVRRLLQRCLRKDPRDRLQHIGDARLELVELGSGVTPAPGGRMPARLKVGPAVWVPVAAALAVVTALAFLPERRSAVPLPPLRLSLDFPEGVTIAGGYSPPFAIDPTGSTVVVEAAEGGASRLYLRPLDDVVLHPLAGTEGGQQPFFSPDGRWIGFFADRKLKKVQRDGGPAMALCDLGNNLRGATWTADGTIVMAAQTSGLMRVSEQGGRPEPLTTLDVARGEYSHRWPDALPGGWVLFTASVEDASFDEARLEAVSMETGERRVILRNSGFGRYVPGERLAFVRGGRAWTVAFDPERLKTSGEPELVLGDIRYEPQNGAAHLAVSASGAALYSPGIATSPECFLAWIDRLGVLTRLGGAPRVFRDARLSPDGARVAVVAGATGQSDLWLVKMDGTLTQLSFGLSPRHPTWSPDGRRIAVGAVMEGGWRLLSLPAGEAGEAIVLLEGPNRMHPNAWSPDGRTLVFQEHRPQTGWDLMRLEIDAAGRPTAPPQPLAASRFHETNAAISPDGRWMAYESDEVDSLVQAYVRSFPGGGQKIQASTGGARWPRWGRGADLYYWNTSVHSLHLARVRDEGEKLVVDRSGPVWPDHGGRPPALARVAISITGGRFDADPARGRFLFLEKSLESVEPPLTRPVLVLGGWADRTR